jgi:epoxyqueuosine reductase
MKDINHFFENLKTEAHHLGFTHIGVAPAVPVPHFHDFLNWVDAGYHADINYLSRPDALAKRANPQLILEDCHSIICLAMPYTHPHDTFGSAPQGFGRVSSYAITQDYHDLIWEKLAILKKYIREIVGEDVQLKSYVDTGPILERSYSSLAGLGMLGKNSCLIIPHEGSYFFLAEILTNLLLPIDEPFTTDLCKNCQRCIEACPTQCILPNRTIDANRCISYLTIENKGRIPDDLKTKIGDWIFGCDVCQIVCPHNARKVDQIQPLGVPKLTELIDLQNLFSEDEHSFTQKYGETPLVRAKRRGLLRNAAVVLGNQNCKEALPVLAQAIETETDPIILDACQWAIDQIKNQIGRDDQ